MLSELPQVTNAALSALRIRMNWNWSCPFIWSNDNEKRTLRKKRELTEVE